MCVATQCWSLCRARLPLTGIVRVGNKPISSGWRAAHTARHRSAPQRSAPLRLISAVLSFQLWLRFVCLIVLLCGRFCAGSYRGSTAREVPTQYYCFFERNVNMLSLNSFFDTESLVVTPAATLFKFHISGRLDYLE